MWAGSRGGAPRVDFRVRPAPRIESPEIAARVDLDGAIGFPILDGSTILAVARVHRSSRVARESDSLERDACREGDRVARRRGSPADGSVGAGQMTLTEKARPVSPASRRGKGEL